MPVNLLMRAYIDFTENPSTHTNINPGKAHMRTKGGTEGIGAIHFRTGRQSVLLLECVTHILLYSTHIPQPRNNCVGTR